MLNAFRVLRSPSLANASRAFSTSRSRASDVAQLTLVGNVVRDAEVRLTKNDNEYGIYTVVTSNNVNQDGEFRAVPTYHRVFCFDATAIERVRALKKGTRVFVQADFSIKEPEPDTDPKTPQGQRQIFLAQDVLKVLGTPRPRESESDSAQAFEKL